MDKLDILKWAGGASIDLPDFRGLRDERILYLLGLDEEQLLDLLQQHHLAAPFLHRFRTERPGWCSRSLLAGVLNLDAHAKQRLALQCDAMQQIVHTLAGEDRSAIMVKGCSAYALTADSRHVRLSYDIDLFLDDPTYLESLLVRLGYEGKRHTESEHEFATMRRGEVNIEIHRYFPVWSYPEGIRAQDMAPQRHPGCWVQSIANRIQTAIRYEDLLENACKGMTPETADLTLTNATMCAFIHCAHEFRYYLEPPFKRSLRVRLGVLASIYQLGQCPHFDLRRFQALVEKFGGHDSVRFVGHLLEVYFGSNPLTPDSSRSKTRTRVPLARGRDVSLPFPRCLTFFGCWATLNTADSVLLPSDTAVAHKELGANSVIGTAGDERNLYSILADSSGDPLPRVVVQARNHAPIPFNFSVSWGKETLEFDVHILERLQEGYEYCLEICDDRIKWQGALEGEWPGGDGHGTVSLLEDGCKFHVSFPWDVVWRQAGRGMSKSMTLVVTKWPLMAALSWMSILEAADPVVMVPITVLHE